MRLTVQLIAAANWEMAAGAGGWALVDKYGFNVRATYVSSVPLSPCSEASTHRRVVVGLRHAVHHTNARRASGGTSAVAGNCNGGKA